FCLYAEADLMVRQVLQFFGSNYPEAQYSPAGAFRMQRNVLDSIDWICTLNKEEIIAAFAHLPFELIESEANLGIKLEGLPPINFFLTGSASAFFIQLFRHSASADFIQAFETDYSYP